MGWVSSFVLSMIRWSPQGLLTFSEQAFLGQNPSSTGIFCDDSRPGGIVSMITATVSRISQSTDFLAQGVRVSLARGRVGVFHA